MSPGAEATRARSRVALLWLASAFAILAAVGVLTFVMAARQVESSRWVEHTHAVIETLETLSEHLAVARRAQRAYVVTGDRSELAPHEEAARSARDALRRARDLTSDNPSQQARLDRLAPLVEAVLGRVAALERGPALAPEHALTVIREDDASTGRIAVTLRELLDEEHRLLGPRADAMAAGLTRTRMIHIVGTGVSFILLTLAFGGLWREIGRRMRSDVALRTTEAALRELNVDLERRVQARTDALETFSYSVAHDLRAPLRSLSGFSEIVLEDYRDKLDAEGVDALNRIRDNARKMAVLIDAMLALSRITRSTGKPVTVDLSVLVHSLTTRLRSNEPRAQLELVIADNLTADLAPDLARTLIEKLVENAW
ncbi:MAG: CHASE3 domain-containing protein, partial [Kofleriaceae bacterium]